jgi:hypothetical protein
VAWSWWRKLRWVRTGASKEDLAKADGWIHRDLSDFLSEFRVGNQKADYWLQKEFGTDGRLNIAALRQAIEARLGAFQERELARAGRPAATDHAQGGSGATAIPSGIAEQRAAGTAPVMPRVNRQGSMVKAKSGETALEGTPPGVGYRLSNPNPQDHEGTKVKL